MSMTTNRYDPLSLFCAALRSVVGWAVVIFATTLSGLWLGMSIGHRELVSPGLVFLALLISPLSWLLFPQLLIAFAITLIAWYLPRRFESTRLRVVAATANFVAWLGVGIWVYSSC
jgi:hypothetical protein